MAGKKIVFLTERVFFEKKCHFNIIENTSFSSSIFCWYWCGYSTAMFQLFLIAYLSCLISIKWIRKVYILFIHTCRYRIVRSRFSLTVFLRKIVRTKVSTEIWCIQIDWWYVISAHWRTWRFKKESEIDDPICRISGMLSCKCAN